ncbi:hypothetical protein [Vibrio coralliirubri]|uniref:hypothetical protein n=1 Tax=Vibrio coralliirubri TaxID=1516159 RepID=UPI0012F79176|nr:hypothetical protein [Vibrio coralliirubri]
MTKKELIEFRDTLLKDKRLEEEVKYEKLRLTNERISKIKIGRPRLPLEKRVVKQVNIKVTMDEKQELIARSKRLNFSSHTAYAKQIVMNAISDLSPLSVNEVVIAEEEFEMIEDINSGIQLITAQLSYAMLEDKISRDDALAIMTQISAVQQKMAEREQRQLGQYNEGFALTIANKYLSAEQLQKMADFKQLREEDQASIH